MRPFLFVAGHLLACTLMISSAQASDDPVPGSCPAPRSCGDRDYWTPDKHFEIEATPKPGLPSVPVWTRPPCGVTSPQALLEHARAELLRTFDVRVRDERDIDWHDWDRSGPQDVLVEVRDTWYPDESARDAPAPKTVTIAVAVCDWTVTADLDVRIDCPWVEAPPGPFPDFFNGGTKVSQSATVNPLLHCYSGPSVFHLDGTSAGSGSLWISGVPFQAYGRTVGDDDMTARQTNCPPCVTTTARPGQRPSCSIVHPPDRNTFVELAGGSGNPASIRFKVKTANPCVTLAPAIDANITVLIEPGIGPVTAEGCPAGLWAAATGSHDAFPTYDLLVNGMNFHLSQHCVLGSTPSDLFGNGTAVRVGTTPLTWVQVR